MFEQINHYGIQTETIASIGQFAVLWGMVEEKYFDKCCTAPKLKKTTVVNNTKSIVSFAEDIKKEMVTFFGPREITNRLRPREKEIVLVKNVSQFLENDEITDDDKTLAAVYICYRVRNNMFHGEKAFWLLDQQKTLIDSCSRFLNELLLENALQIN